MAGSGTFKVQHLKEKRGIIMVVILTIFMLPFPYVTHIPH